MKKKTISIAQGDKFTIDVDYWIEFDYAWDNGVSIQEGVFCDVDRVYITIADQEHDLKLNQDVIKVISEQVINDDDENQKNIL